MTLPPESPQSLDFYRAHAARYAELSQGFLAAGYTGCSHPAFRSDLDLQRRLTQLAPPPARGLDAGCGAGARDVHLLTRQGYDIQGIDAVTENIQVAQTMHPEIAGRLAVADLRQPLPYPDNHFGLVLCNAVIQHLPPETALTTTLPELARVLRPGGILQLMFKPGQGIATVLDPAYGHGGLTRHFQLYSEAETLAALSAAGCQLVAPGPAGELGGLLYFDDNKPMRHCVYWARKGGETPPL